MAYDPKKIHWNNGNVIRRINNFEGSLDQLTKELQKNAKAIDNLNTMLHNLEDIMPNVTRKNK